MNPGQQASPQRTAGVSDQQLAFMAMSNHLLESGLITTSIDKFDGESPSEFWGWINRLKEYAIRLNLSPERTLQLWESYAEGPVLTMIRRHRRSRGPVTHQAVNELFDRLVLRYGDVNRIVTDLESMIHELDPIKDVTDVKQLWNLMDICHLTLANQREGNGHKLSKLNDSEGIKYIRGKLPNEIQTAWSHFGAAYERRFGRGSEPCFEEFVYFLEDEIKKQSSTNFSLVKHIPSTASPNKTGYRRRVMRTKVSSESSTSSGHPGGESPKGKGERHGQTDQSEKRGSSGIRGPSTAAAGLNDGEKFCVHHGVAGHSIFRCQEFKGLTYKEKIDRLRRLKRCQKCTGGTPRTEACQRNLKCNQCSGCHVSLLHPTYVSTKEHEGDSSEDRNSGSSGN